MTQNKTKHLLVENKLNKLKTFDSSYFNGKIYFEEDSTPNYLIFQPFNKYFKVNDGDLLCFIMLYQGHLKDYLMKVLNHLQHLI